MDGRVSCLLCRGCDCPTLAVAISLLLSFFVSLCYQPQPLALLEVRAECCMLFCSETLYWYDIDKWDFSNEEGWLIIVDGCRPGKCWYQVFICLFCLVLACVEKYNCKSKCEIAKLKWWKVLIKTALCLKDLLYRKKNIKALIFKNVFFS